MTLDGFLTFLTIIVAAYTVMSPAMRLRLALHMVLLATISVIAFGLVIYFEFFNALARPCPDSLGSWCEWLRIGGNGSVSPQQWAFVAVSVWLFLVGASIALARRFTGRLSVLLRLVTELVQHGHYNDLAELMSPHLALLDRMALRQLPTMRLYDYFQRFDASGGIGNLLARRTSGASIIDKMIVVMGRVFSSGKVKEEIAGEILRILFSSQSFAEFVAKFRPRFGVQLLALEASGVDEFCESFLTLLMAAPRSVLYEQLRENQNIGGCGYAIPDRNYFLSFLFRDASNANRLAVWRPVGEYVLTSLAGGHANDYVKYLNGSAEFFHERDKWTDKTFIGIQFFDLMVWSALCQGVQWHMWLYYYDHFLRSLLATYDEGGPDIDVSDEWPTRSSYLIYKIFSNLTDWMDPFYALPPESPHRKIRNAGLAHENDSVPKSAALALGHCLSRLLCASAINRSFKKYILEMVMRTIRDFGPSPEEQQLRQVALSSVLRRGGLGIDSKYGAELKRCWGELDYVLRADLTDFDLALSEQYGS